MDFIYAPLTHVNNLASSIQQFNYPQRCTTVFVPIKHLYINNGAASDQWLMTPNVKIFTKIRALCFIIKRVLCLSVMKQFCESSMYFKYNICMYCISLYFMVQSHDYCSGGNKTFWLWGTVRYLHYKWKCHFFLYIDWDRLTFRGLAHCKHPHALMHMSLCNCLTVVLNQSCVCHIITLGSKGFPTKLRKHSNQWAAALGHHTPAMQHTFLHHINSAITKQTLSMPDRQEIMELIHSLPCTVIKTGVLQGAVLPADTFLHQTVWVWYEYMCGNVCMAKGGVIINSCCWRFVHLQQQLFMLRHKSVAGWVYNIYSV